MSVGKDRVFLLTAIIELKTQYETLFKAAMQFSDELEATGRSVGALATQVPAEARSTTLTSMVSGFKLETATFKELLKKLQRDVEKLQSDLPQLDKMAAQNVVDLTHASKTLAHLFKEYQSFIKNGFTSKDVAGFKKSLSKMRLQNGMSMAEVDEALKRVTETSKGLAVANVLYSKDPVNLTTGNFSMEKADLLISGIVPLEFKRTYNTMDDYDGVLGKNWVHSFEIVLSEGENNQLKVMMEDGNIVFYTLAKENSYVSQLNPGHQLLKEDEGYRLTTEKQVVYVFNSTGQLLTQTQQTGEVIEFSYNDQKQLKKVTSQSGTVRFRYTDEGLLSVIKDNAKRKVQFAYDKSCLTTITLPTKAVLRYGYDKQDKLVSITNPRGIDLVKNEYDHLGRTVKQTFPDEGVMTYVYDDESQMITVTEQNGAQTLYHRDKHYRNTKVVYQDGEEHTAYNEQNQKTAFTDKRGFTTYYSYDDRGNLSKVTNPLGEVTSMAYDEQNHLTYVQQANGGEYHLAYDSQGNLLSTKDSLNNETKMNYNDLGLATEVIQADQSRQSFDYDDRGNVIALTHANGGQNFYEYNLLNQVVKSTDALGNVSKYSYNSEGNIERVENAEGYTRTYEYNEIQKITKIKDFDGYEIEQDYNVLGKVEKITDQSGSVTELMYDVMWNISKIKEANGAETLYLYNQLNQLVRAQNAMGQVTDYAYDANSNVASVTNDAGEQTNYQYDALNRRVKVIEADEATTHITYDTLGKVASLSDSLGKTQYFSYDLMGQLVKQTDQLGHETTFTYTTVGYVSTVTDPKGGVTSFAYYPGGKLKSVHKPAGETEAYLYDLNGNLIEKTLGTELTVRYHYDCLNRVVAITNPTGGTRKFSYDGADQITLLQDEAGNITEYYYTPTGKLTSVKDALGNKTIYDYDVVGNLTKIEQYGQIDSELKTAEELNRATLYHYDLLGNVTKTIDALGNEETYAYDNLNQLIQKTDKDNYQTTFSYEMGKVATIQYDDGKSVAFSYNPLRQLIEVQDWLGQTKIEVDELGRPVTIKTPDHQTIGYQFDALGNRTQLTYPDGKSVSYHYDASNKIQALKDDHQVYHYHYDTSGRLIEKELPNELKTSYRYEKGQLTQLLHQHHETVMEQHDYQYDILGNKIEVIKQRHGLEDISGSYRYAYDDLQRLTDVTKEGDLIRQYTYDAFGNRESKVEHGETTQYQYNQLNQLMRQDTSEEKREYGYDKRGNRVEEHLNDVLNKQFLFDATNMMTKVVNQAGEEGSYTYNGLRNRVGQTIKKAQEPLKNIQYLLDITKPYNNMLERQVGSDKETYLWDTDLLSKNQEEYFLLDELGSPLRQSNVQGNEWLNYGYDEFGQSLFENIPVEQPFGFTGYQQDEISELNYAQARYFDQCHGRFMSEDNIKAVSGMPQTNNAYTYVWNNPMKLIDLDGNWPTIIEIESGIIGKVKHAGDVISDAGKSVKNFWNEHIYGHSDTTIFDYGNGRKDTTIETEGGKIFVSNTVTTIKVNEGEKATFKVGGSANLPIDIKIPTPWGKFNLTDKTSISFDSGDWSSIKVNGNRDMGFTNNDGFKTSIGSGVEFSKNPSLSFSNNGKDSDGKLFGGTYSLNKDGWTLNQILSGLSEGNTTFKATQEVVLKNWKALFEYAKVPVMVAGVVGLVAVGIFLVADDATGIGLLDDPLLVPVSGGITQLLSNLAQILRSNPALAASCLN